MASEAGDERSGGAIAPHSPPGYRPPLRSKKVWVGPKAPRFALFLTSLGGGLPPSRRAGGGFAPFFYFVGEAMGEAKLGGASRTGYRPPLRSPPAGLPVLGG
jgi:hypothetical protein